MEKKMRIIMKTTENATETFERFLLNYLSIDLEKAAG